LVPNVSGHCSCPTFKVKKSKQHDILALEDEIKMHSSVTVRKKKIADLDRTYFAPVT
jgi:hypothetical protein